MRILTKKFKYSGDVYQEPECDAVGGTCKLSTDCASGTPITGKCPQQPATVKCCLPCENYVFTFSLSCNNFLFCF